MELLILVVVVVLIVNVLSGYSDEKNFSGGGLRDCRSLSEPHKWSYNKNNRLECTECGFVAGRENPSNEIE